MAISAADVKRLREETDAPMMDCKAALEEAGGDYDRAKEILREKGKAQAAKKADRATKEGIAKFFVSEDGKTAVGVIVECETDFVSNNDTFKALVNTLGNGFLARGEAGDTVVVGDKPASEHIVDAVNTIRENIQLRLADFFRTEDHFAVYNHHTGKAAALVEVGGSASNLAHVGSQLGIQAVGMNAVYTHKDEVPADVIAKEMEIEKARAIEEGKPEAMAENIARGRVNKEFYQSQVLMEQVFYADNKKAVNAYVAEAAKEGNGDIKVKRFVRILVGQSTED